MIAMARRYSLRAILSGVGAAVLILNGMAVGLGVFLSGVLSVAWLGIASGLAFLWFAYRTIGGETGESETTASVRASGRNGAFGTVFGTFFLAELGDKTQWTVLTLAAAPGSGTGKGINALFLLFGASFALFLADLLGLFIGFGMKKALSDAVFSRISVSIFAIFGVVKLLDGLEQALRFLPTGKLFAIAGTFTVSAAFVFASLQKRQARKRLPTDICAGSDEKRNVKT